MALKVESSSQVAPASLAPWDEDNQKLYGNVHPPDWANLKPAARHNLDVIGAGQPAWLRLQGRLAWEPSWP